MKDEIWLIIISIIIAFVVVIFCFGITHFAIKTVSGNEKETNNICVCCEEEVKINYCPMCR